MIKDHHIEFMTGMGSTKLFNEITNIIINNQDDYGYLGNTVRKSYPDRESLFYHVKEYTLSIHLQIHDIRSNKVTIDISPTETIDKDIETILDRLMDSLLDYINKNCLVYKFTQSTTDSKDDDRPIFYIGNHRDNTCEISIYSPKNRFFDVPNITGIIARYLGESKIKISRIYPTLNDDRINFSMNIDIESYSIFPLEQHKYTEQIYIAKNEICIKLYIKPDQKLHDLDMAKYMIKWYGNCYITDIIDMIKKCMN